MEKAIRLLISKGYKNPSAITSILYYKGFEGKFMDIRKKAIHELKQLH